MLSHCETEFRWYLIATAGTACASLLVNAAFIAVWLCKATAKRQPLSPLSPIGLEEITEEELGDTQIFEEPPPKCPRPTRSCLPAWVVREYKSQRRSRVPQGVVPKAAL